MKQELEKIKQEVKQGINNIKNSGELEKLKVKYLGRKDGQLTNILKGLKDLSIEQKKEIGKLANQVKNDITDLIETAKQKKDNNTNNNELFDISLPGKKPSNGTMHPLTKIRFEVEEVFKSMGFEIHEGNELVTDYYNFEALNFPADHPARDMQDTFFIKDHLDKVLRTHTSAMQVKIMENRKPPFKIMVPGRCFRNEATDASHEHTLHQIEGFVVDNNISIANLIWTLRELMSAILKEDVEVRLRPGYFPFVEPGFEMDVSCVNCSGKGCATCKHTGWVEMLGCGMIHQNVFKAAGYKYQKYTGFAFGVGWSRLAMMKYKVDDIRYFMSGDLRFFNQF